jgi:uncharacterized cupin superfamily protein
VKRFNFVGVEVERHDDTPEGVEVIGADIDEVIGAERLRGGLYEIAPGRRSFPYHWEAAKEEWLLVLSGTPTIRTPDGEHELRAGDLTCFPTGPSGAHQVLNHSSVPARVIIFSDATTPNVVVYPDSGKVGVRTADLRLNFLETAAVPYWTGE